MYQDPAVQALSDAWTEILPTEPVPSFTFLLSLLRRPGADVELCIRAIRSVAIALRTGAFETGSDAPQLLSRKVNHIITSDRKRADYIAAQNGERRPVPPVQEVPFDEEWVPFGTKPLKRDAA